MYAAQFKHGSSEGSRDGSNSRHTTILLTSGSEEDLSLEVEAAVGVVGVLAAETLTAAALAVELSDNFFFSFWYLLTVSIFSV